VFDGITDTALKRLQDFYKLPTTGILDEKTISLISRSRCGYPDIKFYEENTIISETLYRGHPKWPTYNLSYQIVNYTLGLSQEAIRSAIAYAFEQWSSVVPFNIRSTDSSDANIKLSFVRLGHNLGNARCTPFDGPGGIVAHAFPPQTGAVHFDDDESWTDDSHPSSIYKDLYAAALHETGHILGLDHSPDANAVMYAIHTDGRRKLYTDDIQNIQLLYGVGT
jgi:hypothetical protein